MVPASRPRLVVNADDFGLSAGVNRGVVEAHEGGVVTSASLMVRYPAAAEAAAYAKMSPRLSLGLHLDLFEWEFRDGEWRSRYQVVPVDDVEAVRREIQGQLHQFRELVGSEPTHLDSHQHAHREEPVKSVVLRVARELGVPVRDFVDGIRYVGDFYGQSDDGEPWPELITSASLERLIRSLPPGITEVGCHPGFDDGLASSYRAERALEVETLCSPRLKAAISEMGIDLISFADSSITALSGMNAGSRRVSAEAQ
ncbi:MAG TPA: ChbG/HpnK family deacetylase [Chloroflexota bacterium]|nr:ChbG/HpnK family deacetylase [Chloroflexota bacterium]